LRLKESDFTQCLALAWLVVVLGDESRQFILSV